jgi:DNA polymerase-1
MERTGIAVDADYLERLRDSFDVEVRDSEQRACASLGREINLGSPKQIQAALFDDLGMPKTKRTRTGRHTTDAEALRDLYNKTGHPFLEQLLRHRDHIKLRQSVDGLVRAIADDGRVHTTFSQVQAATGRLASSEPNLQNIPVRTEAGRRIRQAFVPGGDFVELLTADYSQIEMRIMAQLSGDARLIEAFNSGADFHASMASHVFGVAADEVGPEQRAKIKAMNYGLAYGLSSYGLGQQLGIEVWEAKELMDVFFARFGHVREYLSALVDRARQTGYTETIFGRRRYLPDLTSTLRQPREMAERMALNSPIQGSAADIIKKAMLGVDAALAEQRFASRMLLQVHDELIFEVAPGEGDALEAMVREKMSNAVELKVALEVSVGRGKSWHEAAH